MRPRNHPEYVKATELAEVFGLDPLLAKAMVYFKDINGLAATGAIMVLRGERTLVHKEKFAAWMKARNLPKTIEW